jgi:cytochrome c oxidase subunit 1
MLLNLLNKFIKYFILCIKTLHLRSVVFKL